MVLVICTTVGSVQGPLQAVHHRLIGYLRELREFSLNKAYQVQGTPLIYGYRSIQLPTVQQYQVL